MKRAFQKICIACIAFFAIFVFAMLALPAELTAQALLPPQFEEELAKGGKDWWTTEEYLNIDAVKDIVEDWKTSSDFSHMQEIASDPIVVAVIDSGIISQNNLFSGAYGEGNYDVLLKDSNDNVICQNTVGMRTDETSSTPNVTDDVDNRHGTHVAGIVAELIHMLDLEKYIKIMPIKAAKNTKDGASFAIKDVKEAVNFALKNGADVVNMSFEASGSDGEAFNFVTADMANKAVFVAAAGNHKADSASTPVYPAASKNVVGVMNYAEGYNLASTSSFGDLYELAAPGSNIYSAKGSGDVYQLMSGTSMAAPVVSFAAALITLKMRAESGVCASQEARARLVAAHTRTIEKQSGEKTYKLNALDLVKLVMDVDGINSSIGANGNLSQEAGSVSSVKLSFNISPADLKQAGSVEWFEKDEKIGEGYEFSYIPKNEVSTHILLARWTASDGTKFVEQFVTVTVGYKKLTREVVANMQLAFVDENGKPYVPNIVVGGKYTLTILNADYFDPARLEKIDWYVNGKFTKQVGSTFEFCPTENGTYVIKGEFADDVFTKELKIELRSEKSEQTKLITIVAGVAGAALGTALVIVVIVLIVRRARY